MNTYNNNNDRPQQMVEGSWTCSECGAEITKLPFQPDGSRLNTLKCLDCHRKGKENRGERKMFEGNWTCSECGKTITQMPFEPRDNTSIKCFDCFKKTR